MQPTPGHTNLGPRVPQERIIEKEGGSKYQARQKPRGSAGDFPQGGLVREYFYSQGKSTSGKLAMDRGGENGKGVGVAGDEKVSLLKAPTK